MEGFNWCRMVSMKFLLVSDGECEVHVGVKLCVKFLLVSNA